jgi:hypothetical protein
MLHCSDDLISIWIVLNHPYSATYKLGERTRRTIQILSKSSLQWKIQTRGDNKNNPDTKQWIVLVLSPSLYVAL